MHLVYALVEIFGIYMAHTSEKSGILIENIFEIFGIFYSFPLAMTIEQEGNEVVFFLLSFSDLSHHRTCGSAYGGSLSYVQSDIVVHQTRIACSAEFIIGCGVVHYTFRICPIPLATVAIDSCPIWLDTTSY